MQEVTRRETISIFDTHAKIYIRGEGCDHFYRDDTKKSFKAWLEFYKAHSFKPQKTRITVVQELGVNPSKQQHIDTEKLLERMAEARFSEDNTRQLADEMRSMAVALFDTWKNEHASTLSKLFGLPTGEEVFKHVEFDIQTLPEMIKIPSNKHLLGVGSILEKTHAEVNLNTFYQVQSVEPFWSNPMEKDVYDLKYSLQRGSKTQRRFVADDTLPKMVRASSMDMLDNYFVDFPVPYSPKTAQLRQKTNVPA